MSRCAVDAVQWKNRRAYRLSNGKIEITVLTGGGHIADLRLQGSAINALWESPWPTIEPQAFSSRKHAEIYGDGPVGRFLCGYTGHALALGYFGMPSAEESKQGLPLHGEASNSEWTIISAAADDDSAALAMEITLPVWRLRFRREISLPCDASTATVRETVINLTSTAVDFQWVEHAAFGEPFLANGEAALSVSGTRGLTWPEGYEGHELLASGAEFRWPHARSVDGGSVDLSQPFVRDGTGFVAALLAASGRENAFVAVLNRRHRLAAGYCFDRVRFPWIVLWEENLARAQTPWNKKTRVRGVEFGSSPMPLGIAHARNMRRLLDTPVLCSIPASGCREAQYDLFIHAAPSEWSQITDVRKTEHTLMVRGDAGKEIELKRETRGR